MDIERIRGKIRVRQYEISFTHTEKLRRRRLGLGLLEQAILNGEIIERYPNDPRGPSCLVFGSTEEGHPIHIVCANLEDARLLIVTAYEPNPDEWKQDWRTRKKGTAQ